MKEYFWWENLWYVSTIKRIVGYLLQRPNLLQYNVKISEALEVQGRNHDLYFPSNTSLNIIMLAAVKSGILKRALFHLWKKWVTNSFVSYAHRSFCKKKASFHALKPCYWMLTIWHRFSKGVIPGIRSFQRRTDAHDT